MGVGQHLQRDFKFTVYMQVKLAPSWSNSLNGCLKTQLEILFLPKSGSTHHSECLWCLGVAPTPSCVSPLKGRHTGGVFVPPTDLGNQ